MNLIRFEDIDDVRSQVMIDGLSVGQLSFTGNDAILSINRVYANASVARDIESAWNATYGFQIRITGIVSY
jgi:hypothetical protein